MEPTNAEIKKDTAELVVESHENPSNADLMTAIKKGDENLVFHATEDKAYQASDIKFKEDTLKVHEDIYTRMDTLATQDSVEKLTLAMQESLDFMKKVNVSVGIFKFSWNNASKIGSFILLVLGIMLATKYFFASLLTAFIPK